MHVNLENSRQHAGVHHSPRYSRVHKALTSTYTIANPGPVFHFLNPNGADRSIFLPPYSLDGGGLYWIVNIGVNFALNVFDANGVPVDAVTPSLGLAFLEDSAAWFSTRETLAAASGALQLMTAGGAVNTNTSLVVIDKNLPSPTTLTLPSALLRDKAELVVADYTGGAGPITLVPFGTEKIMNSASWTIISGANPGTGGSKRFVSLADIPGWITS